MKKYGVIYTDSVYHPGDERSRSNPGHGYPAWTENVTKFKEFESREKWEEYIKRQFKHGYKSSIRAVVFEEAEIMTETKITVK